MCGICGLYNFGSGEPVAEELLRGMMAALRHRGPDAEGTYLSPTCPALGLGHTRLSIIDLTGGCQPMANEDGAVWVVQNGEIYNYRELRRDLEARGHRFQSESDTEVILHLYEEHGTACLGHLRGMFAFALWDERRRRLFLARDRLGVKPLVYWTDGERFAFASEARALLRLPGVPRELEPEALHHYLTLAYVPSPLTMFRGIRKLPPAHFLLVGERVGEPTRYWEPGFDREEPRPEAEYAEALRETLREATRLRLRSDVPLGAFLSGGIDSSITVALMSTLTEEPVKTFSIGFAERAYDELAYARLIAGRYHTDHHEFTVRPDALAVLPRLVWFYGEPFADSSALPTYYVSQVTRQFVTVALTGDAGDECFAGYPRYQAVRLASYFDGLPGWLRRVLTIPLWQQLPAGLEQKSPLRRLKRLLGALALPPETRYLTWIAYFTEEQKRSLYQADLTRATAHLSTAHLFEERFAEVAGRDPLTAATYVDLMTYLPDDLLVKVDVASMAHALECRSPFLDHKVVELAARMPIGLKLRGRQSKYLLKKTFADLLPEEILHRAKMGFGMPIARWFRGELRGFLTDVLLGPPARARGYFQMPVVQQLITEHANGVFDHGYRLWALLWFELWCRMFLDAPPPLLPPAPAAL